MPNRLFSNQTTPAFLASALIVLTLAAFSARDVSAQQEDGEFSVMTWNLEWFYDEYQGDNFSKVAKQQSAPSREQWEWKRDAVAAAIAEVRPTVVAMQEVESRRILWYLTRSLDRLHKQKYSEYLIDGTDHFLEQDVGFLVREPADLVSITQRHQTRAMRSNQSFMNLSKHAIAEIEIPVGDSTVVIHVMNMHLRAKSDKSDLRIRQARLAHLWVADLVDRGEHVIVLGDLNTEEDGAATRDGSDVAVLGGRETASKTDDLIDLHDRVDADNRRTHLLPGKQFDRILVSRNLIDDEPGKVDLVLKSVDVLGNLNIRNGLDAQADHWDGYWKMADTDRDISDHLPLMATFEAK